MRTPQDTRVAAALLGFADGRRLFCVEMAASLSGGAFAFAIPSMALQAGLSAGTAIMLTVMTLTAAPLLVTVPAGAWADRSERRGLLRRASGASVALSAVAIAIAVTGYEFSALIFAAVTLRATMTVLQTCSGGAVRALVADSHLTPSVSQLMVCTQIGSFSGPALGGLLVALGGSSAVLSFSLSACALAWFAAVTLDNPMASTVAHGESFGSVLSSGVALMLGARAPDLRRLFVTGMVWNVLAAFLLTTIVPWTQVVARLAEQTAALVLGCGAVGSVAAVWLMGRLAARRGTAQIVALACLGMGCEGVLFIAFPAFAPWPVLAGAVYAVVMLANTTAASSTIAGQILLAPADRQSVVFATGGFGYMLCFALGGLAAGVLSDQIGIQATMRAGGAAMVGLAALSLVNWSLVRHARTA